MLNQTKLILDAMPIISKYAKEIRKTGDWYWYFDDYCINVYDKECAQKYGYTVYAYDLRDDGTCDFNPTLAQFNIKLRTSNNYAHHKSRIH